MKHYFAYITIISLITYSFSNAMVEENGTIFEPIKNINAEYYVEQAKEIVTNEKKTEATLCSSYKHNKIYILTKVALRLKTPDKPLPSKEIQYFLSKKNDPNMTRRFVLDPVTHNELRIILTNQNQLLFYEKNGHVCWFLNIDSNEVHTLYIPQDYEFPYVVVKPFDNGRFLWIIHTKYQFYDTAGIRDKRNTDCKMSIFDTSNNKHFYIIDDKNLHKKNKFIFDHPKYIISKTVLSSDKTALLYQMDHIQYTWKFIDSN